MSFSHVNISKSEAKSFKTGFRRSREPEQILFNYIIGTMSSSSEMKKKI